MFYSMNKARNLLKTNRKPSKTIKKHTSQKSAVWQDFQQFFSDWAQIMFMGCRSKNNIYSRGKSRENDLTLKNKRFLLFQGAKCA